MAEIFLEGIAEAIKVLDELPKSIRRQAITGAAAKSGRPIRTTARQILSQHAKGTDGGFSKVRFISRGITVKRNSRRQAPGARVIVDGPDIPVKGSRYGFWSSRGYAKLLSAGSYKTPNRKGRGKFKGYGNFIKEAAKRNFRTSESIFKKGLLTEMDRAGQRAIKRYGKRGR